MGPESYNQVTRHLAAKVFRGLQVCCLLRTSAQFDEPPQSKYDWLSLHHSRMRVWGRQKPWTWPPKKGKVPRRGSCGRRSRCRPRQASNDLDARSSMNLWWQNDQLLAVTLPTDGWERNRDMVSSACRLLSTWQWSSATHPTSCPPAPTNMEIGWWLPLDWDDRDGSREELWIEAYTCCLQRMWQKHHLDDPGYQRVKEWPHRSALW